MLPEDSAQLLFHPAISVPSILITAGFAGQEFSKLLQDMDPLPDSGNTYAALSTMNALAALGTIYFLGKEKSIPNK
ncbi:MAG: hypothetical protein ABIF85_07550 [Nanoarchaeota archaeon]|nr:hypothetical protein [Nanoarchaeota archaeon]MBU4300921.1 hypothetical protein [Nanoarchaeota archaeon]MBU4451534.1 hypothetical protein [Nanoarchaeota archaeon]MCG2723267.1 hypothetical protein [archaeon]